MSIDAIKGTAFHEATEVYMKLRSEMKLKDHVRPVFDPHVRTRERKPLVVSFTPDDWYLMEKCMGRHINGIEIRELIMGVFAGEFKIVKR